jgi:hypothetical protein
MTDQRLRDHNGEPIEDEGGFLLPHFRTFAAVWNAFTQTYRYSWDEAIKHSTTNALAMRRDAFITGCLQERYLQVAQLPWHLEPEDQRDSNQTCISAALTAIIRATDRWHHFTMQLTEAIWYGRFANQVRWEAAPVGGQPRLIVANHFPVNGDKIQFGFDGTPRVLVHAADASKLPGATDAIIPGDRGPMLELKDPRWRQRFVIHKHIPSDADYFDGEMAGGVHGVGLRSLIYWLWWLRDEMLGWAVNHLKKIGVGGILVFYYEEGNAASKAAAETAAQDAGERYALAMPRPRGSNNEVSHAEMLPFNEAGVQSLTQVVSDYFERHIERLIIGQSLSSKAQGTGMGSSVADLHADTKFRILKFDAENLADTLTRDLVAVAQRWNFPGQDFRVRFVFDIPQPDAKDKLDAATKLYSMNVPLRANDVRGAAGFSKPEAGDEVVSQQQSQQSQSNQNQEDEESDAQGDEEKAVSFQGFGIIPYAKSRWVQIDEQGNRIAWSSAEKRPQGSGWQAYTTPKRKSNGEDDKSADPGSKKPSQSNSSEESGEPEGRDDDESRDLRGTPKLGSSESHSNNEDSTAGETESSSEDERILSELEIDKTVATVMKRMEPAKHESMSDGEVRNRTDDAVNQYQSGESLKRSRAAEDIVELATGLRSDMRGEFLDHFGRGPDHSMWFLDTKVGYSTKNTAKDKRARISAKKAIVNNRTLELLRISKLTDEPMRAANVCYINGDGLEGELASRRGWYFVPAQHFNGELSLRDHKEGVTIPLMTGSEVTMDYMRSPEMVRKLGKRIREEMMNIDPEEFRKELAQAGKKAVKQQVKVGLSFEEGQDVAAEEMNASKVGRQKMASKLLSTDEGTQEVILKLGASDKGRQDMVSNLVSSEKGKQEFMGALTPEDMFKLMTPEQVEFMRRQLK